MLFTSDDVSTYKPEQASLFADTLADTATLTDVSQEGDVLTVRYTQSDRPCTMQFNVYTGQIFAFGADEKVNHSSLRKIRLSLLQGEPLLWNMICKILGVGTDMIRRRCDTVL